MVLCVGAHHHCQAFVVIQNRSTWKFKRKWTIFVIITESYKLNGIVGQMPKIRIGHNLNVFLRKADKGLNCPECLAAKKAGDRENCTLKKHAPAPCTSSEK